MRARAAGTLILSLWSSAGAAGASAPIDVILQCQ
jgi:hypothetical protein